MYKVNNFSKSSYKRILYQYPDLFEKRKTLEEKIREAKEIIKAELERYGTIAVAWSGGKDSTTVLLLALEALREAQGKLVVIHNDTLVENPTVRFHCDMFIEELKAYASRESLNTEVYIGKPRENETFWYRVIVRGYPKPNFKFRWCQWLLKIQPTKRLLKSLGITQIITGLRQQESEARKRIAKKFKNKRRKWEVEKLAPIIDWTEDDVWEFLASYKTSWTDLNRIFQIYREASGECPIVAGSGSSKGVCGARFGCWICTLATDESTMVNLSEIYPNLKPLVEFRRWFREFSDMPENRTGINRYGEYVGGRVGSLTMEAGEEIFKRLIKLKEATKLDVIKKWEIELIREELNKQKEVEP